MLINAIFLNPTLVLLLHFTGVALFYRGNSIEQLQCIHLYSFDSSLFCERKVILPLIQQQAIQQ